MKFNILKEKQVVIDEDDPFSDIAQTERIGLGDLIISVFVAVGVWTLLTLWNPHVLNPALWEDVSVASGLRPASHLVHGYFVLLATMVFKMFGVQAGVGILDVLGRLTLSGVAVVVYAALREMLAFIMRSRPQRSQRRSLVMQAASVVGTFAFVGAEPVWRAGYCLSEAGVLMALAIFVLEFFFLFLRKGSLKYGYLCAFFLGLLTAETPAGIVLLIFFLVVNHVVLNVLPVFESPFFKPAVLAVSKWYLTFIWLLAILIGICINCISFAAHDGLTCLNETIGVLPLMYLKSYSDVLLAASSPGGWILWFSLCIAPFVVAIIRFPSAADEEMFLPYATGIVFLFCGLVAVSQVAPVPVLWFWTHFPVKSDFLLSLGALLLSTTMASAVTILGVDSLCRNHERLARQLYGQEDDGSDDDRKSTTASKVIRRLVVVAVPLGVILLVLPGRKAPKTLAMMHVVRDALVEIVREAGSAKYLFTDGNLDDGIELESLLKGGNLKCLPLVSRTAGSARDVYLRTRGMAGDEEDLFSFKFDVGMGLRSWIRDKPKRLENSAVMMGFDLWKRDGKAMPPMGGFLSRPAGWPSEEERLASVERAYGFCDRVLETCRMEGQVTDEAVAEAFRSVQWRLARLCTYRGEQADLKGDAKGAIAEADRAKSLNDNNDTYKQLLSSMSRHNDMMMQRLTPREGLQLALVRADFRMGKLYAETILVADPENADANFAMGMYYVKERQLTRAEEYLKRCLIRNPQEPSIYNNLAMIQMEIGKLDAAELNAKKALSLIPDSIAVKDTLKSIREKRTGKAVPNKPAK